MKKYILFLLPLFICSSIAAQQPQEDMQATENNGRHRGLDFNVDAGYQIATKGGGGSITAEVGIGKRFNKHLYWGIGTGVFIPTGEGDPSIPITSDVKVFFPLKSTSLTPGVILRTGYVINTASDKTVGKGKHATTIEMPDNIMIQIMPSLDIRLSKRVDFNLAAGYAHFIPTKGGGGSSGAFCISTGFGFHKSPIRKPKNPATIRDRGMQLTLEGGKLGFGGDEYDGGMGAFVISYKFNPHLNIGIGVGADFVSSYVENGVQSLTTGYDDKISKHTRDIDENFHPIKAFLRGQYRLTDKKLSPIIACDAGMRIYSFYDGFYELMTGSSNIEEEVLDKPSDIGFFVSPAIGLSLRTTNNSYLELKAGYSLASSIPGKSGEREHNSYNTHFTETISRESMKMSAPFITLGFTHTFNWGSKW